VCDWASICTAYLQWLTRRVFNRFLHFALRE
jgi:hypothetical protein